MPHRRPAPRLASLALAVLLGPAAGLLPGTLLHPGPANAALPTGFVDWPLASGLSQATGFTLLPDGRALVVRKPGQVHLVTPYGVRTQIGQIPNVLSFAEAGLDGIAIDPDWPARPYIYVFYSQNVPRKSVLERYRVTGRLEDSQALDLALVEPRRLLELTDRHVNHNGGGLRFDSGRRLLVTHGDDVDPCLAQEPDSLAGVLLRLDLSLVPDSAGPAPARSDLVPGDNPYAAAGTDRALVLAHGLRNPFRFTVDPVTSRIYLADVGEQAFEEINEVVAGGENFGWPVWEGDSLTTTDCGSGVIAYAAPIVTYAHEEVEPDSGSTSVAIVGGPRYRRGAGPYTFPPEYEGALFYAEFGQGWIRVATGDAGEWSPFAAPGAPDTSHWATDFPTITDFQQGPDGALYLLTWFGDFHRIVYAPPTASVEPGARPIQARVVPNPFRPGGGTAARLDLPDGDAGPAIVVDPSGRIVRRLSLPEWDGRDAAGRPAPPGHYWIRTRGQTGRVTLVR